MNNDDIKQAYNRCIHAYMRGDFRECIREGLPLMKTWMTHDLLQMLLISAQRLDQAQVVEQVGSFAISTTAADPWSNALLKLTLSKAHPAELLATMQTLTVQAKGNKQLCQLLYYMGEKYLTLGKTKEARAILDAAAKIDALCLEQKLAESVCQFLDDANFLLPDDDATR